MPRAFFFRLCGVIPKGFTMLETLFADISWPALLVRMGATAMVVVMVSWSVGAFGPLVGGALAGLPMVLGPGFYFLATQFPADFIHQAASYALYSLCATQLFVLAYILAARSLPPWRTLGCAVLVWLASAALLSFLPAQPWLGLAVFVLTTIVCLRLAREARSEVAAAKGRAGWGLLLLRGALAGVLVACVTTASQWLGPSASGLLLAFPIGYTVVAVTIHQRLGAGSLIATLRSALLGTASLAGFCSVLALSVLHMSWMWALLMAAGVSMLITVILVFRPWARP